MADVMADIFGLDKVDTPTDFQTLNFDDIFELVVQDDIATHTSEVSAPPEPTLLTPQHYAPVQSAGVGYSRLAEDEPDAKVERSSSKKYKPLPLLRLEKCTSAGSLTPVERAKYDYYPCFVDIISSHEDLKTDFNSILNLFGTPLMFQVRPDNAKPTIDESVSGGIPRFIVQLRLESRLPGTAGRYEKLMKALTTESWEKVARGTHQIDNTQLFVHKHCPGIGLGVELTSISSSVRFLLTVKGQQALDSTASFYSQFLQRQPTQTNDPAIYTLSSSCEFLIRLENESAASSMNPSTSLCFLLSSASTLSADFSFTDERGWSNATDPDGNIVHVKCTS